MYKSFCRLATIIEAEAIEQVQATANALLDTGRYRKADLRKWLAENGKPPA